MAEKENKAVGQVVTDPAKPDAVKPDAEAHLTDKNAHGVDETGAAAPDQVDQALINKERIADPSKRDPRWPAGDGIQAILPEETEHGKALAADNQKAKEEAASTDSRNNPKMGGEAPSK